MTNKRVVVYARVSTDCQVEDGYSIAAQLEATKGTAKFSGHTVVNEYVDRGISGKAMEIRPALMKMLADAKEGLFDEIYVWKLNRLSRNHLDLLKIYDMLESCNVSFRSISEPFDTGNPAGKLLFNMLASIGEFERESLVENVKNGMKQKAREGGFNGGTMLGYRSQYVDRKMEKKQLIIQEEEAEIIRLIFNLYTNGKGYKYIAYHLNELGYKTLRGNSFNIQSIRKIIMNPTYAGKIQFNKYVNYAKNRRKGNENELVLTNGQHEVIINIETWDKAQAILKQRSGKSRKVVKGVFLLTGILKCPVCGSSMVAGRVTKKDKDGNVRKWSYYQCSRYKNYGREECNANSVRADYAEEYVLNKLSKFAIDDKLIEEIISNLNDHVESTVKPIKTRIDQIDKSIKSNDDKKERLFDLYESGVIDQMTLKKRMDKLQEELNDTMTIKDKLLSQIDEKAITKEIPIDRVKKLLKNFGNVLKISTREQKKILLNLVIDKITVNDDREIHQIELRFDESIQKSLLKEDSSNEESSIFMPFVLVI